jgi:hypothetical protein
MLLSVMAVCIQMSRHRKRGVAKGLTSFIIFVHRHSPWRRRKPTPPTNAAVEGEGERVVAVGGVARLALWGGVRKGFCLPCRPVWWRGKANKVEADWSWVQGPMEAGLTFAAK